MADKDSIVSFLKGRIGLGINNKYDFQTNNIDLLLNPGIKNIDIATPIHAPYGIAAKEFLINSGIWDQIQDKLIFAENIRQCLQFLETGNADAGIISLNIPDTDKITIIPLETSLYNLPEQYAVVMKNSKKKKMLTGFLNF